MPKYNAVIGINATNLDMGNYSRTRLTVERSRLRRQGTIRRARLRARCRSWNDVTGFGSTRQMTIDYF